MLQYIFQNLRFRARGRQHLNLVIFLTESAEQKVHLPIRINMIEYLKRR